jgi:hypothetical protein
MKTKILIDEAGVRYQVVYIGNSNVQLRKTKFSAISHIYKRWFIKDVIKSGLLREVSEKGNP